MVLLVEAPPPIPRAGWVVGSVPALQELTRSLVTRSPEGWGCRRQNDAVVEQVMVEQVVGTQCREQKAKLALQMPNLELADVGDWEGQLHTPLWQH